MTQRFALGFSLAFLPFTAINPSTSSGQRLTSAHLASDCGLVTVFGRDACADDIARAGWPLPFYKEGGFDYRYEFQSGGLALDLLNGFLFASTIGWFTARRVK